MTTLREVAKAAGVHISTVSRVLNGHESSLVSAATCERILEVAERLQYRPSAAARALASGRTHVVAVTYSRPEDPHLTPMLAEAHRIALEHGYYVQIALDRDQLHDWLSERRADVVMDVGVVDRADELVGSRTADHQCVIAVGPTWRSLPAQVLCAYWQDRQGISQMAEHLVSLGHRLIAFLAGTQYSGKIEAFRMLAEELGYEPIIVRCKSEDDMLAARAEMARAVLGLKPRPTAIFARNDELALGALHALHESGVMVPDDLSLSGFEGIPGAAYSYPPLTTVRTPLLECVRAVLPRALASLSAGVGECEVGALPMYTSLVVRSSTGPANDA